MTFALDTLQTAADLEAAGIPASHAKAIVSAIARADEQSATKADLGNVESKLEAKIDAAKAELEAKIDALEAKIDAAKAELEAKIDAAKAELEAKIDAAVGGAVNRMLIALVATAGLLFTAIKLFV